MNATPTPSEDSLRAIVSRDMPDSCWRSAGGAHHFAPLVSLQQFLARELPQRSLAAFEFHFPCLWSIDWQLQRVLDSKVGAFNAQLTQLATLKMGALLVFDNPCLTEADLADPMGLALCECLMQTPNLASRAVCVAHDGLRDALRKRYPDLPIECHPNRLIVETQPRTKELYEQLLQGYDRVGLHPDDTFKLELLDSIEGRERLVVTCNETCMRGCPLRKKHVESLAQLRRDPWNLALQQREQKLPAQAGCTQLRAKLGGKSASLSQEMRRHLYDIGLRHFRLGDERLENPLTLLTDIMAYLFPWEEAHMARFLTAQSAFFSSLGLPTRGDLHSGMGIFSK